MSKLKFLKNFMYHIWFTHLHVRTSIDNQVNLGFSSPLIGIVQLEILQSDDRKLYKLWYVFYSTVKQTNN